MAQESISIPKTYRDGQILYERDLEAVRRYVETALRKDRLNLEQLKKDIFTSGWDYDNTGIGRYSTSIEDRLNQIINGGSAITGTSSPTWTIHNNVPEYLRLDSTGLTAGRTFTFPDTNGELLVKSDGILPPIGMIFGFYDFNGALTFNSTNFAYCDGRAVDVGAIGVQTLPDLSNRYLVGFGTEGGGDIDTAAWTALPVGNLSHQVNLQHTHTVNAHVHTVNAHTHDLSNHVHAAGAHTHGPGTLQFSTGQQVLTGGVYLLGMYNAAGALEAVYDVDKFMLSGAGSNAYNPLAFPGPGLFYTANGTGATAAGSGNTDVPSLNITSGASPGTDAASPNTTNSLSTTQSIQPRSVRVRFLMRIK